MRKRMRGWGLPTDLAVQIRPSIRSFLLVHTLRTHPPVFPAPMKRLSRPLILTVQSCERLSALDRICIFIAFTFSTSSFLFISFYIICFSNPSPQPDPQVLILLALSWPGLPALFLACLNVYLLSVLERGNSETSPQHTALISSRQTW